MNKFGVNSICFGKDWPSDFSPIIKKAASIGYDAIELFTGFLLDQPKAKLDEYVKIANDIGIELQFSTGLAAEHDISSEDDAIRRNGIETSKKTLDMIQYMNGRIYAGLIYAAWGATISSIDEKPVHRDQSIKSMREIMETANDCGITCCVEVVNRFEQFLMNTSSEAVAYVNDVGSPNLKIHLDTFHMNIEEENFTDPILEAGDKLGMLHIGESNRNFPGMGSLPWDNIIKTLIKINYEGAINFEPFIYYGGEVANAIGLYRDLAKGATQEEIDILAKQSLEFIRNRVDMLVAS
jgi:D-psicose/D-tagatose/L-ribulose 3-epimerase